MAMWIGDETKGKSAEHKSLGLQIAKKLKQVLYISVTLSQNTIGSSQEVWFLKCTLFEHLSAVPPPPRDMKIRLCYTWWFHSFLYWSVMQRVILMNHQWPQCRPCPGFRYNGYSILDEIESPGVPSTASRQVWEEEYRTLKGWWEWCLTIIARVGCIRGSFIYLIMWWRCWEVPKPGNATPVAIWEF